MSAPAIHAENVSKRYRIGRLRAPYRTIRETLVEVAKSSLRRLAGRGPTEDAEIWALTGLSFEVAEGEAVGIIGRNGAGKSTLLKVLSRITEPTLGRIVVRGRVASLLEVGTGFHHELTGRENVFLNGAILGMRRAEILRKFDQIVSFAEVEKFVDTPVKHYSSGMFMRLAFAIASHLEPEILMVDEVLAVGDATFQKRCLGKMSEVAREGRTVLFVSHNMPAITRLCSRAILLERGRVVVDGKAPEVVKAYLEGGLGTAASREWPDPRTRPGNDVARLCGVRVVNAEGAVVDSVDIRQSVGVEMEYEVLAPGHVLVPNYHVFNEEGTYLFVAIEHDPEWRRRPRPPGRFKTTGWIPPNFFSEGTIIVGAALSTMDPVRVHFYEKDVVAFHVSDSLDGDSARGDYAGPMPGVIRPLLRWATRGAEEAGASGDTKEGTEP